MRLPLALTANLMLVAPIALISALTSNQVAIAQTESDHVHEHNHAHGYEHFYVGVDALAELRTGTYTGLENPNYNRLTFLFAHVEEDPTTNHFHGIGSYSYSGSVDNPVVKPTNTNNRIPEPYTELAPLTLQPGTGIYAERLVSMATKEEYSNLNIEPVALLQNNDEPEAQYLYNSSNGRWNGSLGNTEIGLELVSITDGLNIANEQGTNILAQVGDTYSIGSGDNFSFTPTFWTEASASTGTYSATFRLQELGEHNSESSLEESGTFSLDFQVASVPEPSSLLGLGTFGLLAFMGKSRLKRATPKV